MAKSLPIRLPVVLLVSGLLKLVGNLLVEDFPHKLVGCEVGHVLGKSPLLLG